MLRRFVSSCIRMPNRITGGDHLRRYMKLRKHRPEHAGNWWSLYGAVPETSRFNVTFPLNWNRSSYVRLMGRVYHPIPSDYRELYLRNHGKMLEQTVESLFTDYVDARRTRRRCDGMVKFPLASEMETMLHATLYDDSQYDAYPFQYVRIHVAKAELFLINPKEYQIPFGDLVNYACELRGWDSLRNLQGHIFRPIPKPSWESSL